ncbi:MAG: hypothetical protein BWK76_06785 [Desulfobulbaceae bacterium A2]|nr:MAG: hypothetical protein BWK76_06785 [Desulfobulbaceae bacterium A2]
MSETAQTATVMVVDDSGTVRELIREELRRGGYEVIDFADGLEGYECIARLGDALGLLITDSGARDVEERLRHADAALFLAKQEGRDCVRLHA